MKRNVFIISTALIVCSLAWQCTKKSDEGIKSLKVNLNTGAERLNIAIDQISKTQGYQVLSIQEDETLKSLISIEQKYGDSINLSDISGIYEYQPVKYRSWCYLCFDKLFQKTGDSDMLIVKLPGDKIFHPRKFRSLDPKDSTLENNFVITATDYHYYFSKKKGFLYDYKLNAGVILDSVNVGNLDITSKRSSTHDYEHSSEYTFENGVSINVDILSGDTAISSFSLSDNSGVLLKETVTRIKQEGSKHREKEYSLIIGNIEFRKSSSIDSIQVFVSGVLQQNAKIEVIDSIGESDEEENSICHNRDIKITFDDGSSVLLSELIGPSVATLRNIVGSLKQVYFATHIVDYIAWNIYKNK
jgi:hypothetical protein